MKNIKFNIVLINLMLLSSFANASGKLSIHRWNDQQGLISAKNCILEESKSIPFKISTYKGDSNLQYESIRNRAGVNQGHLANGSIVKVIKSRPRKNYTPVEVIDVDRNKSKIFNRWFSQRNDSGYVYDKSLLPIDDFYIRISGQAEVNKQKYLRLLINTSYEYLNCGDSRKYFIFREYEDLNELKLSRLIAISPEETKIFSNIESISAEKYITKDDLVKAQETEQIDVLVKSFIANKQDLDIALEEENKKDDGILKLKIEDMIATMPQIKRPIQKIVEHRNDQTSLEIKSQNIKLICLPNGQLNVRDDSLESIIFKTSLGEEVQVFQSFNPEEDVKTIVINGSEYEFIKVKFNKRTSKDQNIGWVAKKFVTDEQLCKFKKDEKNTAKTLIVKEEKKILGLEDKNCCEFPVMEKPTHPYTSGARKFSSARGSGRKHAGSDLYRFKNEAILAVAAGEVIRNPYYFYQGTYALEVLHESGFVVRYGELSGSKHEETMKAGVKIKSGQRVGYMGVVNSGCCKPMLHFELFDGSKKGSLSGSTNEFKRREDLIDPTQYLLKWENKL